MQKAEKGCIIPLRLISHEFQGHHPSHSEGLGLLQISYLVILTRSKIDRLNGLIFASI
jgi:hypothetical protein